MRLPPALLAASLLLTALPAAAAPRGGPAAAVLVVTDVAEGAQQTMPAMLWRRLAGEYVGARSVTAEDGTALPDDAQCRTAHAQFAVLATFERATRLPGLAQAPDRTYGIARFTVRNCLNGTVTATKTVPIESDPLDDAARGGLEPSAERTWERAVRAALAREPLDLTVVPRVTRVTRVGAGLVYLDTGGNFAVNQVLRDYADAAGKPYAVPIELVVVELGKKYVSASVAGKGAPRVGDYVEAAPPAKP